MDDQLQMFGPPTSRDLTSAISSPASAVGRTPSALPVGRKNEKSGPGAVPVSRFRAQDNKKAMPTNDTCGPLFIGLSPTANLQRCLENRLRARMDANGSPEYGLIWKELDMPSGVPICALRARARPISAKDFTGWATPNAGDYRSQQGTAEWVAKRQAHPRGKDLAEQVTRLVIAGWTTPSSRDWKDTPGMSTTGINPDGTERERLDQLPRQAQLTSGPMLSGINAKTGKPAALALNPKFSLWLMGYPEEWASCGERAMQLSPR